MGKALHRTSTHGSIVTLMHDMLLSLCLLSAALTGREKRVFNQSVFTSKTKDINRNKRFESHGVFSGTNAKTHRRTAKLPRKADVWPGTRKDATKSR